MPYAVLSQYLTKDAFAEIGINSNHYNASGYNFEQSSGRQIVMGDFLPDDTELGHELILRLKKEYPLYGCGYANGQELLAFYTMVQTSFLLFLCVTVAMTICMAWQVAESEVKERKDAEAWLRDDNPMAFSLRRDIIRKFGDPVNSSVRPEASLSWVTFGFVAALTFILLGCGKWSLIPHSNSSTLLVVLNVMSIVLSALILHLGFFGRLLTLYSRNLRRVEFLSFLLEKNSDNDNYITSTSGSVSVAGSGAGTPQRQSSSELGTPALGTHASGQSLNANLQAASDRLASNMEDGLLPGQSQGSIHNNVNINNIDAWWACRNFVLNNDLSIEYDMGGLAMAMTFQLDIIMFSVVCYQTYHEGFNALLGAPGSYCAYACMYITTCLVKIFTLATQTFEEQDRHCRILSAISNRLLTKEQGMGGGGGLGGSFYGTTSDHEAHLTSDTNRIRATASDYINDYNEQLLNHDGYLSDGNGYGRGNVDEFGIMLLGGSGDDFDDGHGLNMDDTDEDEETPMLPAASVGARSGAGTPKLENRSDANTSDKIGVPLRPTGTVITSVVPPASRDKYNNPYYFSMNSPSLEHNEHVGLSISAPPSPSLSSEGKGLSNRGGGIACSDAGTGCKDDSSSQGEGPLPIPTPIVVPPPPQLKHTTSFGNRENAALGGSKTKPILARATSTQQSSLESKRQTLMDIINQIK